MNKSDLIFVVGRQRSGTTVFRNLLTRSGAADCDEIFHGDLSGPNRFYNYVLERIQRDPAAVHPQAHPAIFGDFLQKLRAEHPSQKLAIDVKYFALNLIPSREDVDERAPFLISFMRDTQASVPFIVRRNKLRVHVSEQISKLTGKWSAEKPEHLISNKPTLTLDISKLLAFIASLEEMDRRAAALLERVPNVHPLVYEEMFDASGHFSATAIEAAQAAMGGGDLDSRPGNLRMNPEPLAELVGNFAEVQAAFRGTRHEWMLDD